jgi:hypothetical protein
MKKVIITRENYEEVMFGLLENEYSKEVRENLLDQIHADTFLSFEWNQWSKATFAESTEVYRNKEAAFLEGLTRDEKKRGGVFTLYRNYAIAASLVLLIGVSIAIFNRQAETVSPLNISSNNNNKSSRQQVIEKPLETAQNTKEEVPVYRVEKPVFNDYKEVILVEAQIPDSSKFIATKQEQIQPVKVVSNEDAPIPVPVKVQAKSRFKVSITEEPLAVIDQMEAALKEKRYTMADVMNRKDGISLSKFLDNAKTHIVEDKEKHITYIEYIAADMSVLVVPLTN